MKKNYWPFGILLIIIIGVFLLVILVTISLIQPNVGDNSYLEKSSKIEKNTDLFLGVTKYFSQYYEVGVFTETMKGKFIPPYLIKAKRIEDKQHKPLVLKLQQNNYLTINFIPLHSHHGDTLKILEYDVYVTRYYDKSYHNHADFIFRGDLKHLDFSFFPDNIGRYKMILKIIFEKNGEKQQAYLQRDFLVKA